MCEPDCIRYTGGANFVCSNQPAAKASVKAAYESAVELFAYLCKLYGLNPLSDGVIVSHKEGCERGIASNHGDPEHLWKGLNMGYTMEGFRKAVKKAMETKEDENGKKESSYLVRVRISDLNIRKGPGTNYEKTGKFTGVGVFSIVAEAAGEGAEKWGKLRSGAGWISLEYGERI